MISKTFVQLIKYDGIGAINKRACTVYIIILYSIIYNINIGTTLRGRRKQKTSIIDALCSFGYFSSAV